MFEFIFGLIWTLFMIIFTWAFYFAGGDITVNGEHVSQEAFNAMLFPKIFIGVFWIIGIALLVWGAKKIIRNMKTKLNGEECFGKIVKIYPSGTYINGRPELKGDFIVYIPSQNKTEIMSEVIGMDEYKFPRGSCVKMKYYEGDINVEDVVRNEEVPFDVLDMLEAGYSERFNNIIQVDEEIVEIDGERYMKI